MRKWALLLLLFITTTSHAADNSFIEKHGVVTAAVVMHALDWSQTQTISWECHNHMVRWETNPLLSRCPSSAAVTNYFLATGAVMLAAHMFLPEKYSYWTDRVWLTVGVGAVAHNISAGVKFSF